MYSIEKLQRIIKEEDALIKELEASYPKIDITVGRFHPNNTNYEIHHTNVRDAYWRRRNWKEMLDGLTLQQAVERNIY